MEAFVEALLFVLKQIKSDCRERDPWVTPKIYLI
tara:strand:+ start:53342 stop:53443 length:102 start_codon:yes stop_codon:yes gene_type:complete